MSAPFLLPTCVSSLPVRSQPASQCLSFVPFLLSFIPCPLPCLSVRSSIGSTVRSSACFLFAPARFLPSALPSVCTLNEPIPPLPPALSAANFSGLVLSTAAPSGSRPENGTSSLVYPAPGTLAGAASAYYYVMARPRNSYVQP